MNGVRLMLRSPDFARLWFAGLVSKTGDWLLLIAMPIFLLHLTGSGVATATVLVIELLVRFFFGQFAGLLADAVDRWLVLRVGPVLQGLFLLPLLAVHSVDQIWVVMVVAAVEAALGVLMSVTLGAMLPDVVDEDDLVAANGMFGVAGDVARLAGAMAGGLALSWGGISGVVVADAVSFALAWLIFVVRAVPSGEDRSTRVREGLSVRAWREGVLQVREDRRLWGAVVVTSIVTFAQGISQLLLIVFVLDLLHGDAADVGVLRGVVGIGTLIGGFLLSAVGGWLAPHRLAGLSLVAVGVLNLVAWNGPAFTTAVPVYAVVLGLSGLPGVGAFVGVISVLQAGMAKEDRGKVFGLLVSANSGAQGVGLLLGGLLIDVLSPVLLLNFQAVLIVLSGVAAIIWLRDRTAAGAGREAEPASSAGS